MLKLVVIYKMKQGHTAEAFLKAVQAEGLDTASRREEGNVRYDYFLPIDGSNELVLLETWVDQDAQTAHKSLPHFKRLGEIKAIHVEETLIDSYIVE